MFRQADMAISTELFAMPHEQQYIVYAPLRQLAFMANGKAVKLLRRIRRGDHVGALKPGERKVLAPLAELGLLNGSPERPGEDAATDFEPDHATLFLTTRCNLRCVYCYASAGDRGQRTIPLDVARAAIDLVAENAAKRSKPCFSVTFHGGGEPTLAWRTLTHCVAHARQRSDQTGRPLRVFLATNGVLSPAKARWIAENASGVTISLDGVEAVQDRQRPLAGGGPSFARVAHTLAVLDRSRCKYSIRATVTDESVGRMTEFLTLVAARFRPQQVQFEPCFSCGRCPSTATAGPMAGAFIESFKAVSRLGSELGIAVVYSGCRTEGVRTRFCKASDDGFCVTPEGYVSSCYEVCSPEDPRAATFFYGRYDRKKKRFVIWEHQRERLRRRRVENLTFCRDCFCKYHCAGDCMVKSGAENDPLAVGDTTRCEINRTLSLDRIRQLLVPQERARPAEPNLPAGASAASRVAPPGKNGRR